MGPERFIIGNSEDAEAEYGSRDEQAVTVIELYEGEVTCVYGFDTVEAAKADLLNGGAVNGQISYL